ncbi:MAG: hypothetical protein AB7O48_08025 [Cyclobacteriaceae bacterium]
MRNLHIKLSLVMFTLLFTTSATAQLDELIDREHSFGIFLYTTSQSQKAYEIEQQTEPAYELDQNNKYKVSRIGLGFNFQRYRGGKGERNVWYNNRLAFDLLTSVWAHIINRENKIDALNDFVITSGFLGNFGMGWNIVSVDDKYRVMLGGHLADYAISSKYYVTANEGFSDQIDFGDGLAGTYIGVGPDIIISYALNDKLAINFPLSYTFSLAPYSQGDRDLLPSYFQEIKPGILNCGVEVMSKWGIFLGLDYLKPLTSHPSKLSRLDFQLGYRARR